MSLTAQRHEQFANMPYGAGFTAESFDSMCEADAELVSPTADRLAADNHTALKQGFLNVAQVTL